MGERFKGSPEGKQQNNSALFAAIETGNDKAVMKLFIMGGLDLNAKNEGGLTPLMVAIDGNHQRIVRQLLMWGADTNAVDNQGQSVLAHAVRAQAKGGKDLTMKLHIFGAK
jgi:ankyrin repeat protein